MQLASRDVSLRAIASRFECYLFFLAGAHAVVKY
jgi:hypothetical protein